MSFFFIFLSLPLTAVYSGKFVCLHSFTNIGLLGHWVFSPPATRQEFGLHTQTANTPSPDLVAWYSPYSLYYLSELFLERLLPPTSGVWLQEFKIKAVKYKYRCYSYRIGMLL